MAAEDYHADFYNPPDDDDYDCTDFGRMYVPLRRKQFPKPNSLGLTTIVNTQENNMAPKNRNKKTPFITPFYLGSGAIAAHIAQGVNSSNTVATLEDAIAQAKRRIENGESNCEIVVKIVAVIQKAKTPVTVRKI